MKNLTKKLLQRGRRILAFAMTAAMVMSMFSTAPSAEAAKWKKPVLSVKKKTLYYNKTGKKTYTLKVKKNSAKKIRKVTWKTNKKKIVSISKKKKMSVKLKAKKAGKATITATVKYVPKGLWMTRTIKLKCKVVSKKAKTTVKPTAKPAPTVKRVVLDSSKEILSTKSEKNTVCLTATVFDSNGKEMDIDEDDIKWTSNSKKVATVDNEGNVKAVSDGTANITASYSGVKSAACVIVVDSIEPKVDRAAITDANTITVYFNKAVEGTPEVSAQYGSEEISVKAALSKDGKSMLVTSEKSLEIGEYELIINGLTDTAGNEMKEDTSVTVEKEASRPAMFVSTTSRVPMGQESVKVFFNIKDQYGESLENFPPDKIGAEAATEGGMPLEALVDTDKGLGKNYVEIWGTKSLPEKRKINITLSYGAVKNKITVTLANSENYGKAAVISELKILNSSMKHEKENGTQKFQLSADSANTFRIEAVLLDEFGYLAEDSTEVLYRIDNTEVIKFAGNGSGAFYDSTDGTASVSVLKAGEAKITAYLPSNDREPAEMKVKIEPTALEKIEVIGDLSNGINGQASEAELLLDPEGTSLAAKDFKVNYDKGTDCRKVDVKFEDDKEKNQIFVKVTADTDGRREDIHFQIVYEKDKDEEITADVNYSSKPLNTVSAIKIAPFAKNAVTAGRESETTFQLLNRYGEDITETAEDLPSFQPDNIAVDEGTVKREERNGKITGILTIRGTTPGQKGKITLTSKNITATADVEVVATAYAKEVILNNKKQTVEESLISGDPVRTVYVPFKAIDQYGNEYAMTKADIESELKIEKEEGISVGYYAMDSANAYSPASGTDKITAVGVSVSDWINITTKGITLGFESIQNKDGFTSNSVTISVLPSRKAQTLVIDEKDKDKVALIGTPVENTVAVMDQYNAPYAGACELGIYISKDGEKLYDSADDSRYPSGIEKAELSKLTDNDTKYKVELTITQEGTYIVSVYIKQGTNSSYGTSPARASYTVKVGQAKNIISSIKISDTVTVSNSGINSKDISISEVKSINIGTYNTLTFSCQVYDKNGREIEIKDDGEVEKKFAWTIADKNQKIQFNPNIAHGIKGSFTISVPADFTEGNLEVNLEYTASGITATPLTVPVSREDSVPQQDKYTIKVDGETEDVCGTTYEMNITDSDGGDFIVNTVDQYGEDYDGDVVLYDLDSSNTDVATVEFNESSKQLTVTPKKTGETTIVVRVTKDITYSFTVKVVEEIDITKEFAARGTKFADEYYNKYTSENPPVVNDKICYFEVPVKGKTITEDSISSVIFNGTKLDSDNAKMVSIGKNAFLPLADYKISKDNKGEYHLLISYMFVALNTTDSLGRMKFTVTFKDGTSSEAVLKVSSLNEDLKYTSIKPSAGAEATVAVTSGTDKSGVPLVAKEDGTLESIEGGSIRECTLELEDEGQNTWKHMVLLKFGIAGADDYTPEYFFTKKVVGESISYGFTGVDGANGELGYYPYHYNSLAEEKVTDYTVATVDRHSVSNIRLIQKRETVTQE